MTLVKHGHMEIDNLGHMEFDDPGQARSCGN